MKLGSVLVKKDEFLPIRLLIKSEFDEPDDLTAIF